ncbi:hypothetical protein HMPREF9005_1973 [Actinomyces sp. oral taxon 178 str. F0338]|nr:hypothetical protein HMPREF9005_1973 [Actinomyces sp. oral taxon 178 str. F0338]
MDQHEVDVVGSQSRPGLLDRPERPPPSGSSRAGSSRPSPARSSRRR